MQNLQSIIASGNLKLLEREIDKFKPLINRAIFFGENNANKVHPLHYVCDCVFEGKISEECGLGMVGLMLENGSFINGFQMWGKDSPLIAAASLYCEEIAFYFMDKGADLNHQGTLGGTALHWAAWTGQNNLVGSLLQYPIDKEARDTQFGATPLLWAIHGAYDGGGNHRRNQVECVSILLAKGSDPKVRDNNDRGAMDYLEGNEDLGIKTLLDQYL